MSVPFFNKNFVALPKLLTIVVSESPNMIYNKTPLVFEYVSPITRCKEVGLVFAVIKQVERDAGRVESRVMLVAPADSVVQINCCWPMYENAL